MTRESNRSLNQAKQAKGGCLDLNLTQIQIETSYQISTQAKSGCPELDREPDQERVFSLKSLKASPISGRSGSNSVCTSDWMFSMNALSTSK